jgi:hypothetical protein
MAMLRGLQGYMRNKLSYYSVLLLVGLAAVSVLVFTMNPFNSAPASASPATQGVTASTSSAAVGGPVAGNGSTSALPGNGLGGLQSGGTTTSGHHHHRSDGFYGASGSAGNSTYTATTTAASIYSQNE